jgi:shikimate kinase
MNVVLVGLRGSGKTTIGKLLAQKLQRPFVDSDEFIETTTHLSIREIFETCGESYFRLVESEAIAQITKNQGQVIATGGGAVLRYKNVRHLKSDGTVFFLDVDPEAAYLRISGDPSTESRRPALSAGKDPLTEMKEQAAFRRPYYLKAADHVIAVTHRNPNDIVQEIVDRLENP